MRTAVLALGTLAVALFVAWALIDWRIALPRIGPGVEPVCAEVMQRQAPDLSWTAAGREEKVRGRDLKTVTVGELPAYSGRLVRVAGVLHAEFEWVALYRSAAAIEEAPGRAPWITLNTLWPDEPYWQTRGPAISGRCVLVEGTYSAGASGHFGMFSGTIRDVLRLDVWSTPHWTHVSNPSSSGR